MDLLKSAKLTLDMIQHRDDLKRLMGDKYGEQVGFARLVICKVAERDDISVTEAALQISKKMSDDGHDPSVVIAALVEELGK